MAAKFDEYTRAARYLPALLVIGPLAIATLADVADYSLAWGALAGPIVAFGLTALLAQIGRDSGKRKEPFLYKQWGGKPSVAHLRHRDPRINRITKDRYHRAGEALIGTAMPTLAEEQRSVELADEKYAAVTDALLRKTRNTSEYPLLFEELKNYGFRRNLWGMKPAGVAICGISIFAIAWNMLRNFSGGISSLSIICALICCAMFAIWIARITPAWVRIAADAYSDRLLEALVDVPDPVAVEHSPNEPLPKKK